MATLNNPIGSHHIEVVVTALAELYVCCVEVTLRRVVAISPDVNTLGQRNINTLLQHQSTALLDQCRKLTKRLNHSLISAIDIEVVSRHRGNHRHIGLQTQERAVELISLHRQTITLAQDKVTLKILRDTTQEGITASSNRLIEPRDKG